jgi:NTE family protein
MLGMRSPEPKVVLALGGGAARGFAHIGVIKELEREQIPIDLVVGTSVGALIGAIYACEGRLDRLEAVARPLVRKDLFDYGLAPLFDRMGLAKGESLRALIRNSIPKVTIEEFTIPFAAVATDLKAGRRVVLSQGSVETAVRASCAIPGIFAPIEYEGRLLVDGWVLENIPVAAARELGADLVIAVDVSMAIAGNDIDDVIDVIVQSVSIMSAEQMKWSRSKADIFITPDLHSVGRMDFDKKEFCLQAGIQAARDALPEIREKIAAWKRANWWRRFVR